MTNQLPSLNSLRAFEVVSRHLNYHSAAAELNVTPAAVKQLVSKLEHAIGCTLLQRKGQGLALTLRGKQSCDDVSKAMELLYSSVEKMRKQNQHRQLIVTVETSFATAWLVPRLVQFRSRFPDISVLIDSNQQVLDISREKVDIAIRYGVKRHREYFVHRLFDDQIFPACSPSLAKGPPKISSLDDLNSVPLIHWDMNQLEWAHETRKWFQWKKWLANVGATKVSTDSGVFFSDYGLAVQAAIAGQGMILASWPILKEPIDTNLLFCPFTERVTTDIGYDLVATRHAHERTEVKAFIDWITDTATRESATEIKR
jgi:LysR family glycine cleavage system transcriptional activator